MTYNRVISLVNLSLRMILITRKRAVFLAVFAVLVLGLVFVLKAAATSLGRQDTEKAVKLFRLDNSEGGAIVEGESAVCIEAADLVVDAELFEIGAVDDCNSSLSHNVNRRGLGDGQTREEEPQRGGDESILLHGFLLVGLYRCDK